ncbi:MAG: outer membrane assembly lipoprotein YfiO [Thermoanaerobaculia bacterium]|jgi:hypothetical protein
MRKSFITAWLIGILAWCVSTYASGDYGCWQRVMAASSSFSDCSSTALLAPGNDTRVNLVLLMMDLRGGQMGELRPVDRAEFPEPVVPLGWESFSVRLRPVPPADEESSGLWASGEGSACLSIDRGQTEFIEALNSEGKLPEDDRERLIKARMAVTCNAAGGEPAPAVEVRSDAARPFAAYLRAVRDFYAARYDASAFKALSDSRQPWVREAALYMTGRSWALLAQANGFDEWGTIDHDTMDRKALGEAESALKAYLKAYPRGRYAASAYGLLRRVHWLAGDQSALAAAYAWQIEQQDAALRNVNDFDLAQEIDAKLEPDAYLAPESHPLLIAVEALRRMRSPESRITREAVEALRPRFKGQPALFDYLLAAHAWFVEGAPARVLQLIPAAAQSKPMTTLEFSRQTLRALTLDATSDAGARAALVALFPQARGAYQRETLEVALAMYDERHGALARVFASASLVVDPALRDPLLMHVAGPDLLRAIAEDSKATPRERAVALYVLLYKQLTRGRYAEFIADSKRLPANLEAEDDGYRILGEMTALADFRSSGTSDDYSCPPLQQVTEELAKSPQSVTAGLCLAEFMRLNGLDYDRFGIDRAPAADELGGSPSLFPGSHLPRQSFYQRVIDDPKAPAEERAYALFRAINCYAPSGNNDCGGADVPVATRKAWFTELKRRYPATPWAKQLRYYW